MVGVSAVGVHAVLIGCMTAGPMDWTDRVLQCMQPSPDAELLASHSMANRAICPAIGLPVPTYLSTYLSIYPSIHLSIYLSIYLSSQPTVSLSDVFTSFGIQISTVETPFCMLSYSKLRKTLPFHMSMQPVCLPSHYSFSLM